VRRARANVGWRGIPGLILSGEQSLSRRRCNPSEESLLFAEYYSYRANGARARINELWDLCFFYIAPRIAEDPLKREITVADIKLSSAKLCIAGRDMSMRYLA